MLTGVFYSVKGKKLMNWLHLMVRRSREARRLFIEDPDSIVDIEVENDLNAEALIYFHVTMSNGEVRSFVLPVDN